MKWLKWIRPLKSLKTYFAQIGDGIIKPILNQYIIKKLNKYLTGITVGCRSYGRIEVDDHLL